MVSLHIIDEFKKLFVLPNSTHYGEFIPYNKKDSKNKEMGKYSTKDGYITNHIINDHLEGKTGLGVIPISRENKVKFGIIDIDNYNEAYVNNIISIVYRYNMPFFPFKSKSGGVHLYLFMEQEIEAKKIREFLTGFLCIFGLPKDTEIFPKQIILEDKGTFINLPYFGGNKRCLIKKDYKDYSIVEAFDIIKNRKVTIDQLNLILSDIPLFDAPPCLQCIYLRNETQFRNNYLFSLGVYCKSKYGDDFEKYLSEANNRLKSPISIGELNDTIINTHRKKEYGYKCNDAPLLDLCNKTECRSRQFGIGSSSISSVSIGQLIQYKSSEPFYTWEINGEVLKFPSAREIYDQTRFILLCMDALRIVVTKLTQKKWEAVITTAFENSVMVEIQEEDDISTSTSFMNILVEFFELRSPALNKEQIKIGKIYKDENKKNYLFKAHALLKFLKEQNFNSYTKSQLLMKLKDIGGESKHYYIKDFDYTARLWVLPFKALEKYYDKADVPVIEFKPEDIFNEEEY